MKCTSPRTVGFKSDGKTLSFSQKEYDKQYATFKIPCGKCISCRIGYSREWAVRCVHESQMHEENCFVTLTYDDDHLESPKLIYKHFQDFMKRLRSRYPERKIGLFVTGEYGEQTKRPHWHAIIFNWRPNDAIPKYISDRGDQVYESQILTELWGNGIAEFGEVTQQSAAYVARYSLKKLSHGWDGTHEFNPISKKSSRYAIGKKWIEKYWPDVFNYGHVVCEDGSIMGIPRYYEKWLQKHQPKAWSEYVTKTKVLRNNVSAIKATKAEEENLRANENRRAKGSLTAVTTPHQHARKIAQQRMIKLRNYAKL